MKRDLCTPIIVMAVISLNLFSLTGTLNAEAIFANHLAVGEFDLIPDSVVDNIGNDYHIYYVHTSHGSQIMTGLTMLQAEDAKYDPPYFYQQGDDLGHNGDTSWVPNTRTYLNTHPECNVAMFSWCGGVSDNTEEGIDIYLNKMRELEADYPDVTFIYMTGHLDGTGPDGNLYRRNNQIRDTCLGRGKILFDFADIESYDPDGVWYPDESDYCHWCYEWCASHSCLTCGSCAHSHCFNCYLKGKAFWWMMAKLSGWQSTVDTCGNANGDGQINIGDVVYLVEYAFRDGPAPDPYEAGDANCDINVNIGDAVYLINFIFKDGPEPCACCK